MDARRFEEVSRRVAAARSRREALGLALAGLGAAVFGLGPGAVAEAAETEGVPIYHCKIPGQLCQRNKACCSGRCNKGVCACNRKGRPCFEPLRGAICCSGRCKNGRCR